MKRLIHSVSALLMALLLTVQMAPAASANSTVTFKNQTEIFSFDVESTYTETDLFDGFKNVMPGDTLEEIITVKNESTEFDYINVYLRAEPHDETDNLPVVESSETVATMTEFLQQLNMKVYNGETLIFEGSPDQAGDLASNVLLGSLGPDQSLTLKAVLEVPIELGNEFANRVGEVDWVFLAEGIDAAKLTVHKRWDDQNYSSRPKSVTVWLLRDGERVESVTLDESNQWTHTWDRLSSRNTWTVEEEVPSGYSADYETVDNVVMISNTRRYTPGGSGGIIIPVPKPEKEDLTVLKLWEDENLKRGNRADFVTVTLFNGTEPVDKVKLSDLNNWTYTWEDLDAKGDWCVLETGVPSGYTPVYAVKDGVVVITNVASLPVTGQLGWPIPVLGSLGALLIVFGILMMRKRKNENA